MLYLGVLPTKISRFWAYKCIRAKISGTRFLTPGGPPKPYVFISKTRFFGPGDRSGDRAGTGGSGRGPPARPRARGSREPPRRPRGGGGPPLLVGVNFDEKCPKNRFFGGPGGPIFIYICGKCPKNAIFGGPGPLPGPGRGGSPPPRGGPGRGRAGAGAGARGGGSAPGRPGPGRGVRGPRTGGTPPEPPPGSLSWGS